MHPRTALFLASVLLSLAPSCREERPLNVVLVSLDSVRADALDFRDPLASPRLEALARRGTIFDAAVSGTSWTLPAHLEMLTGMPPVLHGVHAEDISLDSSIPTLAETLRRAGFFTAGYWTGWYLEGAYGFDRGFVVYENAMTRGVALEGEYRAAIEKGDMEEARRVLAGRGILAHRDVTSGNVAERVARLLPHVPREEGLFLFAHLFDPHFDYVPPEPWDTLFDPGYRGEIDGRDYFFNRAIYDPTQIPPRRISPRDLQHVRSLYRGEIGWTDSAVGRILDALAEADRLDNSLLIVTADHGEEFFEHGGRGHRSTLFEELIRVPMLVVAPGGSAAVGTRASDTQVGLCDLLPTVLDYCELGGGEGAWGRSLRPLVEGGELAPRPVLSSLLQFTPSGSGDFIYKMHDSLRTPSHKLIRILGEGAGGELAPEFFAYFDLEADPLERHPIQDPGHPGLQRAWGELEAELDRLRSLWNGHAHAPLAERRVHVAELFAEDLRALGYTEATRLQESSPSFHIPWGEGPWPPVALPAQATVPPGQTSRTR